LPGIAFFLVGLLVALSAFPSGRIEVAGLLVHPYLIPVALLFPIIVLPRIRYLPPGMLLWTVLFLVFYSIATMIEPSTDWQSNYGELLKIFAFVATVVTAALALRSDRDLVAVTLALCLAIMVMCARGLLGPESENLGINPLEGIANKNAFSMYLLPIMLIASYLLLHRMTSLSTKIVLGVAIATMSVSIFASTNRSGYLGVLLIVVMLASRGRRLRAIAGIALVAGLSYYVLDRYRSTDVFSMRVEQSLEGYSSDPMRMQLVPESLKLGLDHPFFGMSPQWLPVHLRERIDVEADYLDAHNVLGHLIGGCGFTTFLAFVGLLWSLWRRPRHLRQGGEDDRAPEFHILLRMLLLLFLARGMFTREVLYNPCFALGLGIVLSRTLDPGPKLRRGATEVLASGTPKRSSDALGPIVT
jgi:O-antigen ligase